MTTLGALLRQGQHHRLADARVASGHDCDLALQFVSHVHLPGAPAEGAVSSDVLPYRAGRPKAIDDPRPPESPHGLPNGHPLGYLVVTCGGGRRFRGGSSSQSGDADRGRSPYDSDVTDDAEVSLAESFPPIADYGFLSDCENNCLVAPDGSVEWLCLPRPDSPSVFGAILDRTAGNFRFAPMNTHVPAPAALHPRDHGARDDVAHPEWVAARAGPAGGAARGGRDSARRLPAVPRRFRRHGHPPAAGHLHRGPRRSGGQRRARLRVRGPDRHVGLRG